MPSKRQLKAIAYRFRFLFVAVTVTFFLIYFKPFYEEITSDEERSDHGMRARVQNKIPVSSTESTTSEIRRDEQIPQVEKTAEDDEVGYAASFNSARGTPFLAEDVMTNFGISLKEKMTCNPDRSKKKRLLLSWNAGHGSENLGGCTDWHCEFTYDRSRAGEADAILMSYPDEDFKRRPDQYVVYFSQESPVNHIVRTAPNNFFNLSLGYRHDSAAASPYGYTVKLAPESYRKGELISPKVVKGKSKAAAWFVSHCKTNSKREDLVKEMKKTVDVDVYGRCEELQCPKGGSCEGMLDKDYHFYIAFENSICKDYITEKLWNQGYRRDIIPVLLKRSLAEPFVPPNSFIAADDFRSVDELAAHMHYLMKNHTAYMEYFNWREKYHVVFLNGRDHDVLERPWGFCQICRLAWLEHRPQYVIEDFHQYWDESCEQDGTLVKSLLSGSTTRI